MHRFIVGMLFGVAGCAHAGIVSDLLVTDPQPAGLHSLIGVRFLDPAVNVPLVDVVKPTAHEISETLNSVRPAMFAVAQDSNISSDNHGSWETLDSDLMIWRLRVGSEGATSLNFKLSNVTLPEGASLYVYNSDGSTVAGPWARNQIPSSGNVWTPIVHGEEAVLEVQTPTSLASQFRLDIAQTNYGVRSFDKTADVLAKSGSCNVDVACSDADEWGDEIRSVARLTVNGTLLCTGTLMNNTAKDSRPYILTAAHCLEAYPSITPDNMAQSVVAYWNYETSSCGGAPDGDASQNQSGAVLRALWSGQGVTGADMALLELAARPADDFNVHYAGWNRADGTVDGGTAIHHPSGDEKRISFDHDTIAISRYGEINGNPGNFFRVDSWDIGTTEGGSSGSGLWNNDHQLVGQLSGGVASCSNDGADWYGRLHSAWTGGGNASSRLKDWLDPIGNAPMSLCGQEPDGTLSAHCGDKNQETSPGTNVPTNSPAPAASAAGGGGGQALALLLLGLFAAAGRRYIRS